MEKIRELEILRDFTCLADRCPETCCRGWHIAVDEKTMERYENLSGIYGKHVRTFVKKSDPPVFRRIFGVCPFFNSDRLCQFQQNGQELLMPRVCRQFPREIVTYIDITEIYLILSCPATAKVFCEHPGRLSFLPYDPAKAPSLEKFWDIKNEDASFRDFLFAEREKLLDLIWGEKMVVSPDDFSSPNMEGKQASECKDLAELYQHFYAYIRNQHDVLMNNDREALLAVEYTTDKDKQGRNALYNDPTFAFYKIRTIDRMLLNHIDYGYIQIREPKLYYFVKLYLKRFSSMTVDGADEYFDERIRSIMKKHPSYEMRYRSYFSYLIQTLYPLAFESYFILRQLLFAILYTQLLMLFDLLEYEKTGREATQDRSAEILMILERGVRHNPDLTDNLLNIIRQEFL